jgi:hypothetical protein
MFIYIFQHLFFFLKKKNNNNNIYTLSKRKATLSHEPNKEKKRKAKYLLQQVQVLADLQSKMGALPRYATTTRKSRAIHPPSSPPYPALSL